MWQIYHITILTPRLTVMEIIGHILTSIDYCATTGKNQQSGNVAGLPVE
ncbi:MAG: hypothetical protein AB8Z23_00485 [Coxiella-like endosymbiont]|nr:hypothetical protein [Coxiella-like endosymbiont]UVE59446.1 hypothetical protein LG660_03685 [Coxiella-like endosymbiont]